MSLLIKNGTILTATSGLTGDLYIEGEIIRQIGSNLNMDAGRIVDAADRYILPGGVDEHVHYGLLGGRLFETAEAAAVGGTTTVVDFAPQERDMPPPDAIRQQAAKAEDISSMDFAFHVVTMDLEGPAFEEIKRPPEVGVVILKLLVAYKGTVFYCDDEVTLNATTNTKETGVAMIAHTENVDITTISINHYLNQGRTAPVYHYHARPPIAEKEATGRVIALAKAMDCPLFVVHVNAKEAMEAIRKTHSQGWPVFDETCAHYLTLTTDYPDQLSFRGAKYICSPPLRPQEHVDALRQAVREGRLTTAGSDHCTLDGGSEGAEKKGTSFSSIPNDCPGVQNRLTLLWVYDVCTGTITRRKFVELFATNPAKVVGLSGRGELRAGADANIVIFNLEWKGIITNKDSPHGVDYEPFEGSRTQGHPEQVYLHGRLVAENGVFAGEHDKGK